MIGNRVILQPGVVIGSCGFGYTTDKQGRHAKLNQVGGVHIEDDVEIGANTTIDRSRFKMTIVRRGTKIDNLVQIGHGSIIGSDNMIVAQAGIAGSVETGSHVVLAGQCGIAGHVKLGKGVIMIAKSGVDKSLPEGGKYGGAPAVPLAEHNRTQVYLRNIEKYIKQLKALEARMDKLEES
jgi:UDP-3-O-[3-hydroxymyristoyl] glucosamine N-acyltransferase